MNYTSQLANLRSAHRRRTRTHEDSVASGVHGKAWNVQHRLGLTLEQYEQVRAYGLKHCPRCDEWKPDDLEHFCAHRGRSDGLSHYCKPCMGVRKPRGPVSRTRRRAPRHQRFYTLTTARPA